MTLICAYEENLQYIYIFSSSLVSKRPELQQLWCFGTDGEIAFAQAFIAASPSAAHLQCFLHFMRKPQVKLWELHITTDVAMKYIHDILGRPSHLEEGPVDAAGDDELHAMI